MFRELGEELVGHLARALDCSVSLVAAGGPEPSPSRGTGTLEIQVHWLGVSNLSTQSRDYSMRLSGRLEYLAYPEGGTVLERHAKLEALIFAMAATKWSCAPTPSSPEWWRAFGLSMRPSVALASEFAGDTPAKETNPPARRIQAEPSIVEPVSGRVLAAGKPCPGVTVRSKTGTGYSVTGNDGRFSLLRLAGHPLPQPTLEHPHATELSVQWDASANQKPGVPVAADR